MAHISRGTPLPNEVSQYANCDVSKRCPKLPKPLVCPMLWRRNLASFTTIMRDPSNPPGHFRPAGGAIPIGAWPICTARFFTMLRLRFPATLCRLVTGTRRKVGVDHFVACVFESRPTTVRGEPLVSAQQRLAKTSLTNGAMLGGIRASSGLHSPCRNSVLSSIQAT